MTYVIIMSFMLHLAGKVGNTSVFVTLRTTLDIPTCIQENVDLPLGSKKSTLLRTCPIQKK